MTRAGAAMWGLSPDRLPLDAALAKLARAQRALARHGHAHMSLGHMSLRDPEGRGFWLKARGLGLEEVRGPDDFVLLGFDGGLRRGDAARRHAEWPIHAELYRARADVHVVLHSHPFHAAVFSATDAELEAATAEGNFLCGRVAHFREMPGLITTPELGSALAQTLGDRALVLMRNHGVTACAPSIAGAALCGVFVEQACRAQLLLAASGLPWSAPPAEDLAPGGRARLELSPALVDDLWGWFERELARAEGS
jgi:ribulose-5-phosphate 4-epimerase/fuculose-1-phosphate aldolase